MSRGILQQIKESKCTPCKSLTLDDFENLIKDLFSTQEPFPTLHISSDCYTLITSNNEEEKSKILKKWYLNKVKDSKSLAVKSKMDYDLILLLNIILSRHGFSGYKRYYWNLKNTDGLLTYTNNTWQIVNWEEDDLHCQNTIIVKGNMDDKGIFKVILENYE